MIKLLLFAGMITGMVSANLLLKVGSGVSDTRMSFLHPALNIYVLGSLAAFTAAFGFYFFILKSTPLNVAQSLAAAQFVAIIFAANLVLGEPIGLLRWAGILLISIGILLVGLSTD
ncbi:MAG: EamA family transporter [Alphaproteobacteria bacterium]|nr:EamA family transporter [Alphaproteobacteria bacterium]